MALLGQKITYETPLYSSLFFASSMVVAELTMVAVAFTMAWIVNRFARKTFFLLSFSIIPIRALLFTAT